jgi:hypothetical protein
MLQGQYVPKANDADRTLWTLTLETPRWKSERCSDRAATARTSRRGW